MIELFIDCTRLIVYQSQITLNNFLSYFSTTNLKNIINKLLISNYN